MSAAAPVLALWFSSGFPIGAFAYSHGLEWAAEAGDVADAPALAAWIEDVLRHGAGRSDAILMAAAMRRPEDEAVAELAAALQPSAERRRETMEQGAAFATAIRDGWGVGIAAAAYPVAAGRAAAALGAETGEAVEIYLGAFAANLVAAAQRLTPLGQVGAQRVLAGLRPAIAGVAAEAAAADLDDIGGCAIDADIASMKHETQSVRLFRT